MHISTNPIMPQYMICLLVSHLTVKFGTSYILPPTEICNNRNPKFPMGY